MAAIEQLQEERIPFVTTARAAEYAVLQSKCLIALIVTVVDGICWCVCVCVEQRSREVVVYLRVKLEPEGWYWYAKWVPAAKTWLDREWVPAMCNAIRMKRSTTKTSEGYT